MVKKQKRQKDILIPKVYVGQQMVTRRTARLLKNHKIRDAYVRLEPSYACIALSWLDINGRTRRTGHIDRSLPEKSDKQSAVLMQPRILKRRASVAGGQLFAVGGRVTETGADYLPKMPKISESPFANKAKNMDGSLSTFARLGNESVATAVSTSSANINLLHSSGFDCAVGTIIGDLESNSLEKAINTDVVHKANETVPFASAEWLNSSEGDIGDIGNAGNGKDDGSMNKRANSCDESDEPVASANSLNGLKSNATVDNVDNIDANMENDETNTCIVAETSSATPMDDILAESMTSMTVTEATVRNNDNGADIACVERTNIQSMVNAITKNVIDADDFATSFGTPKETMAEASADISNPSDLTIKNNASDVSCTACTANEAEIGEWKTYLSHWWDHAANVLNRCVSHVGHRCPQYSKILASKMKTTEMISGKQLFLVAAVAILGIIGLAAFAE